MTSRSCDAPAPMRVSDALALIRERLAIVAEAETVSASESLGRILAEDIAAPLSLPPFDNSAVDGYAFRFADFGASPLPVAARVPAGKHVAEIPTGSAARIFTGAPLPRGADTVAMQEETSLDGDAVRLPATIKRGANCRRAGEDVACGSLALPAGRRLGPRDLALASALGVRDLPVRRRLRVGVFSTGDEVTAMSDGLAPAGIHDANGPMLAALLARWGALPHALGILRDDASSLRSRLAEAATRFDLIVTSGGVSVGEEDHVRAAVDEAGGIALWRLAIKPGRPLAFGEVGGTPFLGLPGNPGAAYVTAVAVLLPVLRFLSGSTEEPALPLVRSGFALTKRLGRREYLRVCLHQGADGLSEARPAPGGALTGLAASDGLAELGEEIEAIRPGDLLPFRAHPLG